MTNTEFYESLKDEVAKILQEQNENVELTLQEVVKANSTVYQSLVIRSEINIAPVIYLDDYHNRYEKGEMSVQECAELIVKLYNNSSCDIDFDISSITDFEKVKGRITVSIYNTEKNAEKLFEMPHREIEDLSIYYRIDIPMRDKGMGSVVVSNQILSMWNKTVEEIDEIAWQNMKRINPPQFANMSEIIGEMIGEDVEDLGEICVDSHMYILSCRSRMNGAVYIADEKELSLICERLDDDLCILPSSRHEIIILPVSTVTKDEGYSHLKKMVCEVNATQVSEEDFLSDSVYIFERATKIIKVVA